MKQLSYRKRIGGDIVRGVMSGGAGILLYTRAPWSGEPLVVMARESYDSRFELPFSGFEGTSKSREHSPEETAAREFIEESLAAVRGLSSYEQVLAMLRDGDYDMRITQRVHREAADAVVYTTFVKEIAYDPGLPERFGLYRKRLYTARTLATNVRIDNNSSSAGDWPGTATEAASGGWAVVGGRRAPPPPLPVPRMAPLAMLRAAYAEDSLFYDTHPAVLVEHTDCGGSVVGMHVYNDHLEKDLLEYWSLATVKAAIGGTDRARRRVKSYFIPVLNTVAAALGEENQADGVVVVSKAMPNNWYSSSSSTAEDN